MDMDRRGFLKGVGTVGALGALGSLGMLGGCAPATPTESAKGASEPMAATGAGHTWEIAPEPITDFAAEETYDVVVVGAGIAGVTTAYAAAKEGAKVALIEKFAEPTAHGNDIGAVGSKLQKELGIDIDGDEVARLMYQWGQSQPNWYLIKNYIGQSGKVMDQVIDLAAKNGYTVDIHRTDTAAPDWNEFENRYKKVLGAHMFIPAPDSTEEPALWAMAYAVNMFAREAEAAGCAMKFNTEAKQLVRDGERVSAVVVEDAEGFKKLNATNGVVLATGGISENDEMKECWCNFSTRAFTFYFPEGGNLGDGINMGMWVGAQRSFCPPAPIIHGNISIPNDAPAFNVSWLLVNRDGRRFCDEMNWEPILTNAIMNAPGQAAWYIMDSHFPEQAATQRPTEIDAHFRESFPAGIEAKIAEGTAWKADTLDELAGVIGVPADALAATVERYNSMCDTGTDTDFGTPSRFLASVKEGPFYAVLPSYSLAALPYGLRCNENSQVLDTEDNPIEGLFAVGNVQGDLFANTYPVFLPGSSHGRAITYGWLVGEALAHGKVIDGYALATA